LVAAAALRPLRLRLRDSLVVGNLVAALPRWATDSSPQRHPALVLDLGEGRESAGRHRCKASIPRQNPPTETGKAEGGIVKIRPKPGEFCCKSVKIVSNIGNCIALLEYDGTH
jgi:hypothetical protein